MDILPPRRRGQLGAITAGAGVQGPSGGFSIQASSTAKASASPAPREQRPEKGSVTAPTQQSISEQMAIQARAASTVAGQALQNSSGGTYTPGQQVAVVGYSPAAGTPAITQPPRQPNESSTVTALAKQEPQTREQVIQQTLAADAGIAISIAPPDTTPKFVGALKSLLAQAGQATIFGVGNKLLPSMVPWPGLMAWFALYKQGQSKEYLFDMFPRVINSFPAKLDDQTRRTMLGLAREWLRAAPQFPPPPIIPKQPQLTSIVAPGIEEDERVLFESLVKLYRSSPTMGFMRDVPAEIVKWARQRRENVPLDRMFGQISNVVSAAYATPGSAAGSTQTYLSQIFRTQTKPLLENWVKSIATRPQSVSATTASNVPSIRPTPPPPKTTPTTFKTAAAASGAVVGAKSAAQKSATASVIADQRISQAKALAGKKALVQERVKLAQSAIEQQTAAAMSAQSTASATASSQSASPDAKAKAEEGLRTAKEELARAKKELDAVKADLAKIDSEKKEADKLANQATDEAEKAQKSAEAKAAEASVKLQEAAVAQVAADQSPVPTPGAQIIQLPGTTRQTLPEEGARLVKFEPQNPPASGISGATIALGLVAVGAVVYAATRGTTNLNAAPLIAELDEN